jgi:signal transduction histidine kinase/ActR/RegA family two-component response regulator/HAMP domain-containing protein
MRTKATLSSQLNRLVLPIIILPLMVSGCLAFWVYYQDAKNRFDYFVNDRAEDVQAISKAPAIEQYYFSIQFDLSEERDYFLKKIHQLFDGHLQLLRPSGKIFFNLLLVDANGNVVVGKGDGASLALPHGASIFDYLEKVKTIQRGKLFQTQDSLSMVQIVPIWVDFNSDEDLTENEFSGYVLTQFKNPIAAYLGTAYTTGAITLIVLLVAIVCGHILSRRFIDKITKPLTGLARHVEDITHGNFETYNPQSSTTEIANLASAFNQMQAELKRSNVRIGRHIDLLKSLNQLSQRTSSSLDVEEVLNTLSFGLRETLDLKSLHFILLQQDGGALLYDVRMVGGEDNFAVRKATPEEEIFAARFLKKSWTAAVLETSSHKQNTLPDFFNRQTPGRLIGMPLHFQKKPIGMVLARIVMVTPPSGEMLDYLNSIAGQAAISLKNANLFREINEVKELLEQDIIQRERETREKEKLQAQLLQAYKMEAIGTLAGGIAHDFNNILSSIIGFTELAMDDAEKETLLEDNLQQVFVAAQRAKELVQQILTFARQTGDELQPVRVDLIAKETLKLLRSSIPSTIRIKHNIRSKSLVMGNATQFHQVFMNLCTNASQAMEQDGGTLEIVLIDVVLGPDSNQGIESLEPGEYLKISVSDTGVGITQHALASIFEPFYTTKDPGEGTGMGLSVVHGIVQRFGGDIFVESRAGEGTLFTVFLPVTKAPESPKPMGRVALKHGTERILIIDDDEQVLEMGSRVLCRLGYTVTAQSSSVEAMELVRNRQTEFDLVISDVTMPDMTGDQLAEELQKINPHLPIILLTGYSKKIDQEKALKIGVKAFAFKPIIQRDLTELVRKVLDDSKKAQ